MVSRAWVDIFLANSNEIAYLWLLSASIAWSSSDLGSAMSRPIASASLILSLAILISNALFELRSLIWSISSFASSALFRLVS
jgi:hypothetical protein